LMAALASSGGLTEAEIAQFPEWDVTQEFNKAQRDGQVPVGNSEAAIMEIPASGSGSGSGSGSSSSDTHRGHQDKAKDLVHEFSSLKAKLEEYESEYGSVSGSGSGSGKLIATMREEPVDDAADGSGSGSGFGSGDGSVDGSGVRLAAHPITGDGSGFAFVSKSKTERRNERWAHSLAVVSSAYAKPKVSEPQAISDGINNAFWNPVEFMNAHKKCQEHCQPWQSSWGAGLFLFVVTGDFLDQDKLASPNVLAIYKRGGKTPWVPKGSLQKKKKEYCEVNIMKNQMYNM